MLPPKIPSKFVFTPLMNPSKKQKLDKNIEDLTMIKEQLENIKHKIQQKNLNYIHKDIQKSAQTQDKKFTMGKYHKLNQKQIKNGINKIDLSISKGLVFNLQNNTD